MKIFRHLYVQVLVAILLGVALGQFRPEWGAEMKPLGDAFIKAIKLLIAPIIFLTVVTGIAGMGDLKKIGRVGLKSLLYFEGVSTLALIIGLVVVNWVQPGAGLNANAAMLVAKSVAQYTTAAQHTSVVEFLLHIIPDTFLGAFTQGDILEVLFVSILFGFALAKLGERAQPVLTLLQELGKVFFGIVNFVIRFAPVAAFGAMAFTIGKFGVGSLLSVSYTHLTL